MAEMKNRRQLGNHAPASQPYKKSSKGMAAVRMFQDELAESDPELTHGVPFPTNAHPEQQYMDMSNLAPMRSVIKDRGDGEYDIITPSPSLSQQVRDQVLNQVGTGYCGMTFHSALKKEQR